MADSATTLAAPTSLRPMRAALWFNFFNAMTWQVALGTPMVLLAERLGASALAVGAAYSFVFLLTPVQVLATAMLPRFGCRRMMLSGWGSRSLFVLPIAGLAWLAPETAATWHVAVLIGSVFLFTLFRSLGTCAWLPWVNALLTPENRGRYFATEQAFSGVAGVGTLLLCSWSLASLPDYRAFSLQFSFAFVGSWLAYAALSRLPDVPKPAALPLSAVTAQTPRLLTEPGTFRQFVALSVVVGVAVTAIPPFCAYYLRVGPEVAPARIVFYTLIQYLGVIVGAIAIRERVDRRGARPFMGLALGLYAGVAGFWIVLLGGWGGGLAFVPASYFLVGFAASSWAAANMKYLPLAIPADRQTLAFSVHTAVTAVGSGLSATVWGLFIKAGGDVPAVDVPAFVAFFVVLLVLLAVAAILIGRLPAAAGAAVEWSLGGLALRPFRGFTFLATLVVTRPDAKPPKPRNEIPR